MKTSRYNILLVLWALMLLVACSDSSSDEWLSLKTWGN